ncbi:MAG TPA: DinB family protein [Cyclobacteriaceae bacterium]|jgi:hypothetical protein
MARPEKSEYSPFYQPYIDRVEQSELITALQHSFRTLMEFPKSIPPEKYEFRYNEGKWTVKEVFIHLADTERVMQYRALRFSRNDKAQLHAFDENDFIKNSNSKNLNFEEVYEDLINVRKSSLTFFKSCSEAMLLHSGIANNANVTVRALGFIIAGHQAHHFNVIHTKYF